MDSATRVFTAEDLASEKAKPDFLTKPVRLLLFGNILIGLGLFALYSIATATIVSVYFVAISMIVAGGMEITVAWRAGTLLRRVTWMLIGGLYIGAGLFALLNPLLAAEGLTLLLGASLVGTGIVRLVLSFQLRPGNAGLWTALSAAVTTLLGIMVLAQWPASSLYILGIFLSVDLIVAGVCWAIVGAGGMFEDDATATAKS